MKDESAIIVYTEEGEIEEIVFQFGDVEQAKKAFEKDFTDPSDFYKSPDNSVEQTMELYVRIGKKSLDWESPRVKTE